MLVVAEQQELRTPGLTQKQLFRASTSEDGELKGARGEMIRRVGRDEEGEEEGGGGE